MNQLLKQMLLVCVCLFALNGHAIADPLSDAEQAYEAGNYAKAVKLYRLSAEQGNASGQYMLGAMYNNGRGVSLDYQEAVKWYRLAAEQGNTSAQVTLGDLYHGGRGVPQDFVLAHMWLNIAAGNADDSTHKIYATERDLVAKQMTSRQIAEAQELARKCTANKFKGC